MKSIVQPVEPDMINRLFEREFVWGLRWKAPTIKPPYKVYVYLSKRGRKMDVGLERGKIVGEYVIKESHEIVKRKDGRFFIYGIDADKAKEINSNLLFTGEELQRYFSVRKRSHIMKAGEFKIYETPKNYEDYGLTSPPQSFCYTKLKEG